ncbi:MAG: hypothetical protein IJF42_07595 [Clostridia bacterium]|nr:hypothetical protein [Clostridia bacterium]
MPQKPSREYMSVGRTVGIVVFILLVFVVFSVRLFQIQIVDGAYYADQANKGTQAEISVSAARGEVLDTYNRPMVVNRTTYQVVFDSYYFPLGSSDELRVQQASIILSLAKLLETNGETWQDTLPISVEKPYTFKKGYDNTVSALKASLRLADYATADQCMAALVEKYGIVSLTAEQQRLVVGVQYTMTNQGFPGGIKSYTFSTDVSKATATTIMEQSRRFVGVDIVTAPVRDYVSGTTASHLIGLVGPIYDRAELDALNAASDKTYQLSDRVGKSGIEKALESVLCGVAGVRTVTKDSDGLIIGEELTKEPIPGDTVILTLDGQLQQKTQDILDAQIKELRASSNKNINGCKSGSVVMLDMTGGVIVAATWPNYDLSTYYEDYETLITDPDNPMFNRALDGAFVCGSVFKPAVAVGALNEKVITPSTCIVCTRKYTYYSDYQPSCMHSCGRMDVSLALARSCNYFFFDVGRLLGIDKMNAYCRQMGLGELTGIEVGENKGTLAGIAQREAAGGVWNPGDTISAAIGQADNRFTPLQLATYCMTLANGGTRYKTHLVKSTLSYDGTTEKVVEPVVLDKLSLSDGVIREVQKGMEMAVTNARYGTLYSYFKDATYTVAGKSGTAQTGIAGKDHGTLLAYAPADNPQVAIAVVMENGGTDASKKVARQVLDAYFATQSGTQSPTVEGELLP